MGWVFFPENSVTCFSLGTLNKQIPFDDDLADVCRAVFLAVSFPSMLGKRLMGTEGNVSYSESERGKSRSGSREAMEHVVAERARWQRFRYCFGTFLSAFSCVTVTEHRPNRACSVYIPPASSLGDGAGKGEGRKQRMIDGF